MSERNTFVAGVIPAKRGIVTDTAQTALLALVDDLTSPDVFREINYRIAAYIIGLEVGEVKLTLRALSDFVRQFRNDGLLDDYVAALVQVYIEAKTKYPTSQESEAK